MASELSPIESADAALTTGIAVPVQAKTEVIAALPIVPTQEESDFAEQERLAREQDDKIKAAAVEDEASTAQYEQALSETEDALLTALDPIPLPPELAAVQGADGRTRKVIIYGALTLDVYI